MNPDTAFTLSFLKPEDAQALHVLLNDNKDAFKPYFPQTLKENKTLNATKKYILNRQKIQDLKSEFTFAIHTVIHPEIAGLVILKEVDLKNKNAELAYCLSTRFQGRGWATDAVEHVANFGYINHQISTYKIITHASHKKSIGVAERTGFIWDSTLKDEFKLNGKKQDMELYILKK